MQETRSAEAVVFLDWRSEASRVNGSIPVEIARYLKDNRCFDVDCQFMYFGGNLCGHFEESNDFSGNQTGNKLITFAVKSNYFRRKTLNQLQGRQTLATIRSHFSNSF